MRKFVLSISALALATASSLASAQGAALTTSTKDLPAIPAAAPTASSANDHAKLNLERAANNDSSQAVDAHQARGSVPQSATSPGNMADSTAQRVTPAVESQTATNISGGVSAHSSDTPKVTHSTPTSESTRLSQKAKVTPHVAPTKKSAHQTKDSAPTVSASGSVRAPGSKTHQ
jgi:hypothetical protein